MGHGTASGRTQTASSRGTEFAADMRDRENRGVQAIASAKFRSDNPLGANKRWTIQIEGVGYGDITEETDRAGDRKYVAEVWNANDYPLTDGQRSFNSRKEAERHIKEALRRNLSEW